MADGASKSNVSTRSVVDREHDGHAQGMQVVERAVRLGRRRVRGRLIHLTPSDFVITIMPAEEAVKTRRSSNCGASWVFRRPAQASPAVTWAVRPQPPTVPMR